MGFVSHRVERSEMKPGDHIYTWRAVFSYSHHGGSPSLGIFVGGSKVVHFTAERIGNLSTKGTAGYDATADAPSSCPNFPDCGFRQPNSGVLLSCLNCFLGKGSLYQFEYGAAPSVFLAKVRGGTCATAQPDPTDMVIHRAMYLLQNGFGNYDVVQNNCEDFALYCKTGLVAVDGRATGTSGQAFALAGATLAALLCKPLRLLMRNPFSMAAATVGVYNMSRYATDIGVRTDLHKVAVEDLAVAFGWAESAKREETDGDVLMSL